MKPKLYLLPIAIFISSCGGSSSTSSTPEEIKVYISKGDTQCNDDGLDLEETTSYLTDANIEVLQSECGKIIGLTIPTVCGASTENIYVHTIMDENLADAENIGFMQTSAIENDDNSYQIVECI